MPQPRTESTYLVEHYRPGLDVVGLDRAATHIREHFVGLGGPRSSPRFLGSVIVPADEAFLVVVRAESELHVREAYLVAGAAFDRITVAITDLAPLPSNQPGVAADDPRVTGSDIH
jgi:hypothetical protein